MLLTQILFIPDRMDPATFPTSVIGGWGNGSFATNRRSYVHSICEVPYYPHYIYKKSSLHVYKLDNLLKYPDCPNSLRPLLVSLIFPGEMRLLLSGTHMLLTA